MEASLLRIARVRPAQLSRGSFFRSHLFNGGDEIQCRIGLSQANVNICNPLSPESAVAAGSARDGVGTAWMPVR
jgi:hypothetical protein